jgi:3-phenylpropionate/trans-cinnamate dioxygenase ferredoxin subunit
MSRELQIGRLDELEDGVARRVEDNGNALCVVRCGGVVYAIDDTCSHEDYSLAAGEVDVEECAIECSKHGSLFSLATGAPLTFPATRPVEVYAVTIEDGIVTVHLPDIATSANAAES